MFVVFLVTSYTKYTLKIIIIHRISLKFYLKIDDIISRLTKTHPRVASSSRGCPPHPWVDMFFGWGPADHRHLIGYTRLGRNPDTTGDSFSSTALQEVFDRSSSGHVFERFVDVQRAHSR